MNPDAQRSAFPQFPGVPSFGAVLIAVTATVLGVAIEAGTGGGELGTAFAVCYVLGCVGAVLAVRQSAIFTAVIQPPLLLFVTVPLAYYLFHGEETNGLKGFLITCGYPLIERFPLMLFAAATALAIGLARWYLPAPGGFSADADGSDGTPHGLFAGIGARLFGRAAQDSAQETDRPPRHSARPGRSGRPDGERQARPRRDTRDVPPSRRRRSDGDAAQERRRERPARDAGYPRVQGHPRDAGHPEGPRRAPRERRNPQESRGDHPPRPGRAAGYEPRRDSRRSDYGGRDGYSPRESYPPGDGYPPREGYAPRQGRGYPPRDAQQPYPRRSRTEPPPRRDAGDHHPVSRVRYRGDDPDDSPRGSRP